MRTENLQQGQWRRTAAALALFSTCGVAAAQSDFVMPRVLRVCDDPNNMPFSNARGEGFENKVVSLLGAKLGLPVEYYHYPQRMNVFRNTLRYKLPGESDYRCDLLTGVPVDGDGPAAVVGPTYRSTYVLAFVKGRKFDVSSEEEFLALDRKLLAQLRIGVFDRSPATRWLVKHELDGQGVPYRMLQADPEYYPGRIVEDDLVNGKIDVALVWGPIGGYFAKKANGAEVKVIPLASAPGVRFDFEFGMGVRKGEKEWQARLQRVFDENAAEIAQILRDYGVPILEGPRQASAR